MDNIEQTQVVEQKPKSSNPIIKFFRGIGAIFGFINNNFKALLFVLILLLIFGGNSDDATTNPNLTCIEISGAITNASRILEKIQKAKEDKHIKGVLLNVNSPGGALAPSVEIAYAVRELAKTKTVVAYASGTMASGSYYSSIWSKKIYANPGSFIGSIGVIFQGYDIEELTNKIGIKPQTIKAGKYKEAGTFMRPWTKDEKEGLTTLIDDAYELFSSDVAKARGLNINDKDKFANARIFLASKAKKVGLIDEVGTLSDAKEYLKQEARVKKAIWQKKDKFEKAIDKLVGESSKVLINTFYGLKAY